MTFAFLQSWSLRRLPLEYSAPAFRQWVEPSELGFAPDSPAPKFTVRGGNVNKQTSAYYRATSLAGPWTLLGTNSASSYLDVAPGSGTFYYRVEAIFEDGRIYRSDATIPIPL